ncbi:serine protease FAM111A-like [Odontesthes bonariensis]|uniref:serine protease FAM111A-like n=1 Tax=Odontesthes bonariensis TaxID=219752 RepID=UPI003F5860B7
MAQKAQKRVKEESTKDAVSSGKHEHRFKVKFGSDDQKYTIDCHQPQTLLEAIKFHLADEFNEKIKGTDENIYIRLGEGADASLLATNFPCCCVDEDECLTIRSSKRVIEAQNQTKYRLQEKEHYCVFYIENVGGKDSKSKAKQIFRCTDIREEFRYFCVYGEKSEMTVEQALKQDGRFEKHLSNFTLCDNKNNDITKCTASLSRKMNNRYFRIQLTRSTTKGTKQPASNVKQEQQKTQCASNDSQSKSETISVLERAQEKGISVKEAIRETGTNVNMQEIYDLLREQFQGLKGWMENRFPGQSFQKALKVSKENFGKIQQSFRKMSTVRELVKLGESVCLLRIYDTRSSLSMQGTGFVLFGNFILTNAHLFEPFANRGIEKWWEYIKITAEFHFETPVGSEQLDYALLELIPESHNAETQQSETSVVPPGLLKRFGPLPGDGGACVVGHPAGGVKETDPTCIIRKDKRDQAVDQSLEDYQNYLFTVCSIKQAIETHQLADVVVTYNTFMYHGSSGSPVFDAHGQVFCLHSGGFFFGYPKPDHSVIEYCYPLLGIFKELVSSLKKAGSTALLARVCEEAKGNPHLEKIIEVVAGPKDESSREGESSDSEELMDTH